MFNVVDGFNSVLLDTTIPVISLTGAATINLDVGDTYTELGATAIDNIDGDITGSIVITGTVDTGTEGSYTVYYNVSDAAENAATQVARTVVVSAVVVPDTTPPVITLTGSSTINLTVGDTYTELGATATDETDGDITADIVITGTVDTATAATYTKYYNVSDAAGNAAAQVTRSIIVSAVVIPDTTKPVIVLSPAALTYNLTVGDTFTLPTATLTDDVDSTISINPVSNDVNTATAGAYSVVYSGYEDAAGNVANSVTVTVNVAAVAADTTPPVITVSGSAITYITIGDAAPTFTASALDNVDGVVTVTETGDTIDNATVGTYVRYFNAIDAAENEAVQVTRTVIVVEENGLLEEVAQTLFSINKRLYTAYKGRGNIETLKFKPIEPIELIEVDADGYFDFDNNEVTKVEFILGDGSIDSESTFLSFDGSELNIETGALDIDSGVYSAMVVVYIGSDTKGTVICGPGLTANCVIDFR